MIVTTCSPDLPSGTTRLSPLKVLLTTSQYNWRRIVFGLLMAIASFVIVGVSSRQAQAASFDCTKAELPLDELVCQTPDLSAKDDQMAAKLDAALAILSPEGQSILLDGQRKWLIFVWTYCTPRIGLPAGDIRGDALQCLRDAYDLRLEKLDAAAVKVGGFVFSRVDDAEIWPGSPHNRGGFRGNFDTCDFSYPRIDAPRTPETAAWNDKWREWAGECPSLKQATDSSVRDSDTDVDFQIKLAQGNFISLTGNKDQSFHEFEDAEHAYGPGGTVEWHILLPDLRDLTAADLFAPDSGWRDFVIARCKATLSEYLAPTGPSAVHNWEQHCVDVQQWNISANKLAISFDLNADFREGAGHTALAILWTDLKPFLAPNAPIKVPSN